MTKEALLSAVIAELYASEPTSLGVEDQADHHPAEGDQAAGRSNIDWAPKRINAGWAPRYVNVDWAPKQVQTDWSPKQVKADWNPKYVNVDWAPKKVNTEWHPTQTEAPDAMHHQGAARQHKGIAAPPGLLAHLLPGDGQTSGPVNHPEDPFPSERVWLGVRLLLQDYVGIQSDDSVIVAYTPDSRTAAAWILTELKTRHIKCQHLVMRPLVDTDLAARLYKLVPSPEALRSRLVIITVENHTMSHVDIFRKLVADYDPRRWFVARIIGASEEFFTHAMQERKSAISDRNAALLERFMKARKLRIRTRGGSDLQIRLDSDKYDWISNRGSCRTGGFLVLPPGEIATYPKSVDGIFVADGAININILARIDARLARNPVRVTLRDGRAVGFSCPSAEISEFIEACFSVPNMTRVGELGFGTNQGIPEFVPANSHINERRSGVHLGFGQNNQSTEVVDYQVDMHMDLITDGAQIWVDDDQAPLDLGKVPRPLADHPSGVLYEDIDRDCCGLWLNDVKSGLRIPRARAPEPAQVKDSR